MILHETGAERVWMQNTIFQIYKDESQPTAPIKPSVPPQSTTSAIPYH